MSTHAATSARPPPHESHSSLRSNAGPQYLSAHSTELLGSGAHSSSTAYDVKDPSDWLRWMRKLVTRRGWWSNAFVGWTMVTGVVILGLVARQWVLSSGFYTVREIVVQVGIAAAQIFSAYISVSAIQNENIFEVWGSIFFSGGVFAYTIIIAVTDSDLGNILHAIQTVQPPPPTDNPDLWYYSYLSDALLPGLVDWGDRTSAIEIATCVVCGVQFLAQCLLAPGVWREVKWKAFKRIGADRKLQMRFTAFTLLILQIKLSLFFSLLSCLYFLPHGAEIRSPTFLAAAATGYFLHWVGLFILLWAIHREKLGGVMGFMVLGMTFEGVLIDQLSKLWPKPAFIDDPNFLIRDMGTFLTGLDLAFLVGCMCTSLLCAHNFGRGLRKHVDATFVDERAEARRAAEEKRAGVVVEVTEVEVGEGGSAEPRRKEEGDQWAVE